jgi:hypothetical protein
MSYQIERTQGPAAEHTLIRLWNDNLNMRGDPRHKFEWYYRDNPTGPATAFLLRHDPGDGSEPAVVGSCGVGTRHVFVDGRKLTAALFADFTVDKAHRTLMPALMLQRALCEFATASHDLAYAFPNDAAVGIFNRIGLKTVGRARRYVKILRSRAVLEQAIGNRAVATAAAVVADAALSGRDRLRSLGGSYRFEWLADPDERFDRLWNDVRPNWKIIGERSAAFLKWRFTRRVGLPGRIAALVDRSDGHIGAYAAVVEKDPGDALIADFLALSNAHLTRLLRRLGPALAAEGCTRAVTYFLGPPAIDAALTQAGFQFRNDAKFVIAGAREGAQPDTERLARAGDWYITEADRDN